MGQTAGPGKPGNSLTCPVCLFFKYNILNLFFFFLEMESHSVAQAGEQWQSWLTATSAS